MQHLMLPVWATLTIFGSLSVISLIAYFMSWIYGLKAKAARSLCDQSLSHSINLKQGAQLGAGLLLLFLLINLAYTGFSVLVELSKTSNLLIT